MARGGRPDRVLVVGAGIAGLATARALYRQGIECDVVDRAESWKHPGAGMYLLANSVRALDLLGLRAPVLERAHEIVRQRFLDHRGRLLLDAELTGVWGSTAPCLALGRRELHDAMREGIVVRQAMPVCTLREEGTRVHAVFADGRAPPTTSSSVPTVCARSCGPPRAAVPIPTSWAGELALPRRRLPGDLDVDRVARARQGFPGGPLGAGCLYCYADLDAAQPIGPFGGDPKALVELYGRLAEPVPTILEIGLATSRAAYFSPIEEVAHQPWVHGRIALVEDAAHAVSPNMAQGAGMALEDALVIAETLASGQPLEAFEARRRPRVAFVRAQTRPRDRTRRLPSGIRNAALRLAGQRIFRSSYVPLRAEPKRSRRCSTRLVVSKADPLKVIGGGRGFPGEAQR